MKNNLQINFIIEFLYNFNQSYHSADVGSRIIVKQDMFYIFIKVTRVFQKDERLIIMLL